MTLQLTTLTKYISSKNTANNGVFIEEKEAIQYANDRWFAFELAKWTSVETQKQ